MVLDNRVVTSSIRSACPPNATTALTGARILVVDDDPDMQRLLSLIFSHEGATVLPMGSASAAIEAFGDFKPQLVVSDLQLPQLDGLGLIRLIRSLPSADGGGIPAVMLTGDSSGATRRKALHSGFNALLSKPIRANELLDAARGLLTAALDDGSSTEA